MFEEPGSARSEMVDRYAQMVTYVWLFSKSQDIVSGKAIISSPTFMPAKWSLSEDRCVNKK